MALMMLEEGERDAKENMQPGPVGALVEKHTKYVDM